MLSVWDPRHQAVIRRWHDLSSVVLGTQETRQSSRVRHIVTASGKPGDTFDIDALYQPGSGDVLIVAFHGALVRERVDLPRFEWLGALRERSEHRLYIADTTLSASPSLTLGWYLGDESDDLTEKITRFINHVRNQLSISKTILLGSSGGGYAALAVAPGIDGSNAIAFSPQTDVWKFSPRHTQNLLEASFPGHLNEEELVRRHPTRFSLIERYKDLTRRNRFVYVQNEGDVRHVNRHFKPFAQSLGVRLPNGRTFDQRGRFVSLYYGDGHAPPPKDSLNSFLDLAISDLEVPTKKAVMSAGRYGPLHTHSFIGGDNFNERVSHELNTYYQTNDQPLRIEAPHRSYAESGVPLRVIDGELYDHPVMHAQFMLKHINTLRRTRSAEYSDVLHATAQRIMSYAVESRGAHFLPFLFPWRGGKQQPPWYSAMAQGQVLSAISRLHEVEPRPEYEAFAASLSASFQFLPEGAGSPTPWVVDIDTEGHLWFDEYPNIGQGKFVLNGHLFAVWGLYDYWRVFDDAGGLDLANAGLETTKRYMLESRTPGWSSHYDVTEFSLLRNYHQTHVWQMEATYNLTGDPYFLEVADILESDFPSYQRKGFAVMSRGAHQLCRMDNPGVPTKRVADRVVHLGRDERLAFTARTKVEELPGIWLRLAGEEYEGWWVQEVPDHSFPANIFDRHVYRRPRRVALAPGDHSYVVLDDRGNLVSREKVSLPDAVELSVGSKSMWRGRWYYEVSNIAGDAKTGEKWLPMA
ncbi:D-glucuronyl C5-epimerase family protein [Ornithinimicrobium cavernae]|uniref:D-glucuronyl C5-epimerase family protein n=1 Tax=Ornithinimicrobium cavernae TaxID=2666047 RepID=UPI00137A76D3|nr:D-glucuronyl C5-epimerase family protein [Ornithinimicrobium cavernae]